RKSDGPTGSWPHALVTGWTGDLFPGRSILTPGIFSPPVKSCTVQTALAAHKEIWMNHMFDRRDFLKLAGLGGVVLVTGKSALANAAGGAAAAPTFTFVQLSDTHWGFEGPPNPDAKGTLKKAVAAVNSLSERPDFVMFTGDLTHTTDDPKERRQ